MSAVEPRRLAARTAAGPSRASVAGTLGLVYVVWGSTYYFIRVAIDTMPPLLMGAVRFTVAGAILYVLAVRRGDRAGDAPKTVHWRSALISGVLLLTLGNGGLIIGEQYIPTSICALIIATVPLWLALMDRLFTGRRLRPLTAVGIAVGLLGVALLLRPGASGGASQLAMLLMLVSPICWAAGSLYSRDAPLPARPLVGAAMQMLTGGGFLFVAAAVHGELGQVSLHAISPQSLLALAYLVVLGSLVAFSAYVWLLRNAPTPLVSTYAYVNPLVAVLLGWALLDEHIGAQTLLAAAVIVAAVAMIVAPTSPRRRRRLEPASPSRECAGHAV